MNKKLIARFLGAILCIEAAAMLPAFLMSLYYQDGDTPVLGFCILGLLLPGGLLWKKIITEITGC